MVAKTWLAMAATALMALAVPGTSEASTKRAARAIGDAIEEARDGGKKCRRAVLGDLKDARDDVEDMPRSPSRKSLRRLVGDLKSIKKAARKSCDEAVSDEVRRAIKYVRNAMDDDDDDDDRRRRRRRRKAPLALTHAEFSQLQSELTEAPSRRARMEVLEETVGGRTLTSIQLGFVITYFKTDPRKADAIRVCAPRLSDPQNAVLIPLTIGDAKAQADASRYIARVQE